MRLVVLPKEPLRPKLSGIDVIKQLRAAGKAYPILILTARGRWQDKVEGLEAGGDDYLVKPFHVEELLARINALTRRAAGWSQPRLRCGPFRWYLCSWSCRPVGSRARR